MSPYMLPLTRRAMLCQLGTAGLWVIMRPVCSWSTLTLPKIAETGNSVSLTVAVDSPMTPADHVLRIHVFVGGNPEPVAATYYLGVRAGRAEITTRIRLARTQTVLALAEMSDGTVRSAAAGIVVTLGACIEDIYSN
jgi:sulfur-oxidizing protein SoxY